MNLEPVTAAAQGPSTYFTGVVHINTLHAKDEPSQLIAVSVRFTPGARTNWHVHVRGQLLHCTDGTGLVVNRQGTVIRIRPGDTVWTPPGEEHWHGATADSMMCHLAVIEGAADAGDGATWFEAVSDHDYDVAQ